ncbi:unnamed protein product [Mytilus coruscus]|uniref:Uncharacterized protein n=1 Tax=Mytilus coruscus TaxID=42192 RepID=A0A6J8DX96_MYTCO|nr:unnamed protein product [Mytilus coruscus]
MLHYEMFIKEFNIYAIYNIHLNSLVLKDSLRKKWCLPWNIKDNRVEFTFGDDSSWNCRVTARCNVEIQIIPENKDTYICPIPTPKSKEWSSWTEDFDDTDWNSPSDDDDDDDDSENQTLIIALIISCTLIMMCGCFCKYKCKRNSEESEPRRVINMHYMQNSIYQRKADQPTASESSDEGPGNSENIRDVRHIPDIETWAASFANDNSETMHDEQLQEATQDNSDPHLHQLPSWSENIEDHERDPPPSYEDVCSCSTLEFSDNGENDGVFSNRMDKAMSIKKLKLALPVNSSKRAAVPSAYVDEKRTLKSPAVEKFRSSIEK